MRVVPPAIPSPLLVLVAISAVVFNPPHSAEAQSVWRCGKLFTTQGGAGCREVKATISTGVDGAKVFVSGDSAPAHEPHDPMLLSSPDSNDPSDSEADEHPRLTGTLFTTDNERSLGSASSGGRHAGSRQRRPTRVIKTGCFASSLYGNQPSQEGCDTPALSISNITSVLK